MDEITEEENNNRANLQANFSSILYVISEQQALIGKLLQVLLDSGVINSHQLAKITDLHEGDPGLLRSYESLYKKYAWYFLKTRELIKQLEAVHEDVPADIQEAFDKWKETLKNDDPSNDD